MEVTLDGAFGAASTKYLFMLRPYNGAIGGNWTERLMFISRPRAAAPADLSQPVILPADAGEVVNPGVDATQIMVTWPGGSAAPDTITFAAFVFGRNPFTYAPVVFEPVILGRNGAFPVVDMPEAVREAFSGIPNVYLYIQATSTKGEQTAVSEVAEIQF